MLQLLLVVSLLLLSLLRLLLPAGLATVCLLSSDDRLAATVTTEVPQPDFTDSLCTLHGISSRAELNGTAALVVGYDRAKGRYRIRLPDGSNISVLPSKVLLAAGSVVTLRDLSVEELNGRNATVVGTKKGEESTWRCVVRLEGEEAKEISVNVEKMLLRNAGVTEPFSSIAAPTEVAVGVAFDAAAQLMQQGRLEEAEALWPEVITGYEALGGPWLDDALGAKNNYADLLQQLGKLDEACKFYRDVIKGQTAALGANHASTLSTKGKLMLTSAKNEAAEKAIAIASTKLRSAAKSGNTEEIKALASAPMIRVDDPGSVHVPIMPRIIDSKAFVVRSCFCSLTPALTAVNMS